MRGWPACSMSTRGSRTHMPMQPTVVTWASMLRLASPSRMACMVSRAPAAMPQVPMPTVIVVPVSMRTFMDCCASSRTRLRSSRVFSFGIQILLLESDGDLPTGRRHLRLTFLKEAGQPPTDGGVRERDVAKGRPDINRVKVKSVFIHPVVVVQIWCLLRQQEGQQRAGQVAQGLAIRMKTAEGRQHCRAPAGSGFDNQLAAGSFGCGCEQRQPQPHMARIARGKERAGDLRESSRVHAAAVVAYRNRQPTPRLIFFDRQLDPGGAGLHRILYNVQHVQG